MILNLILLLASQYDCDPNRPGIVYGWNETWVFKAESIAGDGLPPVGVACWAVEIDDWPTYCIGASKPGEEPLQHGGPERMAPRECIVRDTDGDGDYDLRDFAEERR